MSRLPGLQYRASASMFLASPQAMDFRCLKGGLRVCPETLPLVDE
jgi:hypothetical protein